MKKPQPIQISIPQPCHEDWNKMPRTEQGRFCSSCQKCVVDFAVFTDRELYEYISKHKDQQLCGRFNNLQLNRPIHIPHQPHSLLYKYVIAFGLTLALVQAPIHSVFAKSPYSHAPILSEQPITNEAIEADSVVLRGRVLDNTKEPLIGAFVEINNKSIKILTITTDADGYYTATLNIETAQPEITLRILFPGFKTQTINLNKWSLQKLRIINLEADTSTFNTGAISIEYRVPLIDPLNPSNRTFTSDEIEKMPR